MLGMVPTEHSPACMAALTVQLDRAAGSLSAEKKQGPPKFRVQVAALLWKASALALPRACVR